MKAKEFITEATKLSSKDRQKMNEKFFAGDDSKTKILGVKFGEVFKLAKKYVNLSLEEVTNLLDSEYYEIRMGAAAILDYKAQKKNITEDEKKTLFDFYLSHHDRLNNWDFVDRASYRVIGDYLIDKPKDILYKLAKSNDVWERRTAIVATYAFIKKGNVDETFTIAEILLHDKNEYIHKAVGSWLREAGKKDEQKLKTFLDKHSKDMPNVTLRYAVEKLKDSDKQKYISKRK